MGFLKNTWVNYWDRTYQQIKDSVLTRLGAKVPEITDHTENSIHVVQVDIFAGIAEMQGYYIDNAARESFIDSARLYASGISLAKLMDYKVIGNLPFTTDLVFTSNIPAPSNIIIPAGTICMNGVIPYVTQVDATILAGASVSNYVGASQYTTVNDVLLGEATGLPNMEIALLDQAAHNSIVLKFSGIAWNSVDTLGYSSPIATDFVQTVNKYQQVAVYVGNGMTGKIPPIGQEIRADYRITLGSAGASPAGSINTIQTSLVLPPGVTVTVNNPAAASGGQNVETLDQMKSHIPIAVRTLKRAVTRSDYEGVLELAPGVLKAGVYFNCGKSVDAYIVPDGGGLASSALIASSQLYIDDRKMITTKVTVYAAGELRLQVKILVNAQAGFLNAEVEATVRAAVLEKMKPENQTINGSVFISDIFEAVEKSQGVVNSIIQTFVPMPYARPLTPVTPILDWTREITIASTSTVRWRIVFTTSTTFQLLRETQLIGTYPVGGLVVYQEARFTVNAGAYSAGNQWEFITYPYTSQRIILQEPSLPVVLNSDLIITVTGGL